MQKYFFIALGGSAGAIARYWVDVTVSSRMGTRFPYGTLVINISACFIIGFALTFLGSRAGVNPAWRYLIPVGFVGAYSTFSTYEWEMFASIRAGAFFMASLYAVTSLVLGLLAIWCGVLMAETMS